MKGLFVSLLIVFSFAAQAEDMLPNLLQCTAANVPENLSLRRVQLATTNSAGNTSTIEARVYATREKVTGVEGKLLRAMMHVDAPEYLDGAAYLVRETDDYMRDGMFIYLPSVGRVRRVTGSFTDGALMGSKFSYFEFKQLSSAFRDLTPQIKGTETIGNRPVTVVRFTPLDGTETRYTSVLAWFDQKTCLPLRADFSEGDTVIKRLSAQPEAIAKSGGYWYLQEITMRVLADDSYSVMRVKNVSLEEQVSDYFFNPETFFTVQ